MVLADCFAGVLRNLSACVALNPATSNLRVCYQDWAEEATVPPLDGTPDRDVSGVQVRLAALPPGCVNGAILLGA